MTDYPCEFKNRRRGKRRGEVVLGWFHGQGCGQHAAYREVTLVANRRYIDALLIDADLGDARERMRRMANPVRTVRGSHRGLNPACQDDVELIAAVMRGEHSNQGFRNGNIRYHLFGTRHRIRLIANVRTRKLDGC